jgi:hypothetical protein
VCFGRAAQRLGAINGQHQRRIAESIGVLHRQQRIALLAELLDFGVVALVGAQLGGEAGGQAILLLGAIAAYLGYGVQGGPVLMKALLAQCIAEHLVTGVQRMLGVAEVAHGDRVQRRGQGRSGGFDVAAGS